ncbi:MAG: AMP-binding protein, partial [Bifidobacteriaceae bacterium]|nr:AMP-binding protein [Bifidobacteriaceae bacterium]
MTSINFKYRLDDENPKNIWTRFLNTKGQYQYINPKGVALGDKDNIYSILAKRIARNPDEDMVSEINSEGHFEPVIAKDYLNRVRSVAKGMLAIGIKKGTPISIISHTSLDWAITDVAALSIGAVVVPIYETSSTKQISYIFQDSDIEYVFCENSDLVDKCKRTNLLQTDRILNYQKDILNQLISRGEKISDYDLDKKIDQVKSSDL